ncbi:MAG: adenine phosphoribosyltransferase [Defluviitaleaceae bacterium]|nr:adenine phosphoribosyltransferase [Defluviitaleaceae bacterium]
MDFTKVIRTIPNFPEEGIMFRDITTVLHDGEALHTAVDMICSQLEGLDFDLVLGPESRGFIFGTPAAYKLKKGFVPVRKAGKLPYKTLSKAYDLEYGQAIIEIHEDAIKKGQKVVVVDDLLATGGTCKAICELVEEIGGIVEAIVFFIELEDLNGREVLKGYNISSLVKY